MPKNPGSEVTFFEVENNVSLFLNQAKVYINQGDTDKEKSRRKKLIIAFIKNGLDKFLPDCPYGMTWDPISQTCK